MMTDVMMQDLLSDLTDAVMLGTEAEDLEAIQLQYDLSPEYTVDDLLPIIIELDDVLVEVHPRPAFAASLKSELVGVQYDRLMWRIRKLPPRVHVAALMAIMGGALLILRRRFSSGSDIVDIEEATA